MGFGLVTQCLAPSRLNCHAGLETELSKRVKVDLLPGICIRPHDEIFASQESDIMLVIARRFGQLGNRLFLFAHLIAAAKHYQVRLRNPCFAEYAGLFPQTSSDLWCEFDGSSNSTESSSSRPDGSPSLRKRMALMKSVEIGTKALYLSGLRRRPFKVIRLSKHDECDLQSDRFEDAIRSGRTVLLQGWRFRSDQLLMENWARIRDYFALSQEDRKTVDDSVAEARGESDVLVGVHIRRGDYANFLGGRYYFSDQQYANWMHQVREQYPNRRVNFLVCSHEKLDESSFAGLNLCRGPGSALGDMYALAETDLMLGPPSTFTGWAGFIGQKPRIELDSADARIELPGNSEGSRLARVAC
ncbi:hypothetical protein LOC67_23885 [Stieleria sp. JC731]|uniref:hypothetical protein n=1 Tax=Pirellulaceae TaxID=2691357 RepID=UPI001E5340C6|nr:hypothetical protein [Stieleria sp. JC731]MCC9603602.1 hypothetical protein [Stieleria sp. JC731]